MKINVDVAGVVPFDPNALHEKYVAEREKRLHRGRKYADVIDQFSEFAEDIYADQSAARAPVEEERDVVVVGGGLAGLVTATRLRQAGVDDFRVIEQGGDFGGTWYFNRYPGVRCDVESYIYIPLLEEVDTVPTERYATGAEILRHCRKVAEKFRLYDGALFNTSVTSLRWDDGINRWLVETDRGDRIKARQVLVSNGQFHRAKLPNIPGVRDFAGHAFHSSRWDYDYTGGDASGGLTGLADKRVALIGSGATGIQILPMLARDAGHVTMIQRTPAAIDARNNGPTDVAWFKSQSPGWQQRRMDDFMMTMTGMPQEPKLVDDCWTDIVSIIAQWNGGADERLKDATPAELQQLADYVKMEEIRARISSIVDDQDTADKLKPWYNLFCKRPGFSDDYLQTFNRPNVTLVDTEGRGIERITPNGVQVDGKVIEVDCIIFATGFEINTYAHEMGGYELVGRDGLTLGEYWKNGMRSVHGVQVSNFPNFQIVGAITQAAIAWNYPHVMIMQADHAVRVAAYAIKNGVDVTEVSRSDEDDWLAEIRAAQIDRMEFFAECTPGYYNNEGDSSGRPPLFASAYGAGPVKYEQELMKFEEELQRRAAQRAARTASA